MRRIMTIPRTTTIAGSSGPITARTGCAAITIGIATTGITITGTIITGIDTFA
jgi:hypothetical protein